MEFHILYGDRWQEPTHIYPQTETVAAGALLPKIVPGTRLHLGDRTGNWVSSLILVGAAIYSCRISEYERAELANPFAAWNTGMIDVTRTTTLSFIVSGGLRSRVSWSGTGMRSNVRVVRGHLSGVWLHSYRRGVASRIAPNWSDCNWSYIRSTGGSCWYITTQHEYSGHISIGDRSSL